MEPSRWDPSCERGNHGQKINTALCHANTMICGHPRIRQENSKWKFRHRRWIWLDYEQQSVSANLGLLLGKFDLEPNTRVVEHFLIFPTLICMSWYNKRFKSYEILKLAGLLEFCAEQIWVVWEIWTFDPDTNWISGNFLYYHCR
jgi:hypothetical protein